METNAMHSWKLALVARHGAANVRIIGGKIEVRGTARNGGSVWHFMGKLN
jgi:hypothetical protein